MIDHVRHELTVFTRETDDLFDDCLDSQGDCGLVSVELAPMEIECAHILCGAVDCILVQRANRSRQFHPASVYDMPSCQTNNRFVKGQQ